MASSGVGWRVPCGLSQSTDNCRCGLVTQGSTPFCPGYEWRVANTLDQAPSMQLSTLIVLPNSSWIPHKLSLDTLKLRLYVAVELPKQEYAILSSTTKGSMVEMLVQNLHQPVEQLEVDALNGWLFWTDAQGLWRLDLASKERLQLYQTSNRLGRFILDIPHWFIHLLLPDEEQLLSLSYDGNWRRPIQLSPGHWQTFTLLAKSLLMADDTQLHLMDLPSGEKISKWSLTETNDCWALVPLMPERERIALDTGIPRQLVALLGSQAAHISWKKPARNPYQSRAAANNLSYELEVLDVASQSAYNIRNIRSPSFGLERLQPDNLYQLRVRAINSVGKVGEWTPPYAARTWPLGPHRFRWATQSGELYETNELGQNLNKMENVKLESLPGSLAMVNTSSGYYVSGDGVMRCINLIQPQMKCVVDVAIPHVGAVAYDWRGGRVYWTDLGRNCVIRLDPWTGVRELLPIFGATDLALDPQQGHLYYTTAMHLKRRGLSPQPGKNEEVEYYHLNGLEGSIDSFTLDLKQHYVYWVVKGSGAMRIYRSPLVVGSGQPEEVQLLLTSEPQMEAMPKSLQLLQPLGALLWVERSGRGASTMRLPVVAVGQDPMPLIAQGLEQELVSAVQLLDANSPSSIPDSGVIPLAVPPDSLRIDDGHWDDFHLRWQPAGSGGNHTVSYRLLLEYGHRLQTHDLSTPFARILQLPQPQLNLKVCLTPHTSWRAGPTTCVELTTPAAAPTQPRRLRVFVERRAKPLQTTNISALLRWDAPEQAPIQALEYHISCWQGSELHSELLLNQSALEARVEQLQAEVTYRFQVEAHVAATGAAAGAASHGLHVAPEVQAVPRLLYVNSEFIGELDLDTRTRRQIVYTSSPVEHLAVMEGEQRLLWVNEHVELLTHVPGSSPAKLARMRAEVLALTVDWVQRMVYWAELDAVTPQAAVIYRLNLCLFEGRILQGERMWSTPRGYLLKDLVALPHSQTLVWLEHELDSRNATLQGRSLVNGSHISFEISSRAPLMRLFEGSLEPGAETLNLVDHLGKLCVYDVARQLCTVTALRTQMNYLNDDVRQLAQDAGYLYALRNGSIRAYGRRRQQLEYLIELEKEEVRLLHAHNYQAYPEKRCLLLPPMASLEKAHCQETQCLVKLPALYAASECQLPVPGLRYTLQSRDGGQWEGNAGDTINITDLHPYTKYQLRISLWSYYQKRSGGNGSESLQLPILEMQTAPDTPTAPRNFTARVLSPNEVEIHWLEPQQMRSEGVYYMLYWQLEEQDHPDRGERRIESSGTHRLTGLQPGSSYQLWVQAHATPAKFNMTSRLHVKTFEGLADLQLIELGAYGLTLTWEGTTDPLSSLFLECESIAGKLQVDVIENYSRIVIENLEPKTRYDCHLALSYVLSSPGPVVVYHSAGHVYETLSDAPSAPGKPQFEHIAGEIFRLSWSRSRDNGSPIQLYNLEALQARRSLSNRRRRRDVSLSILPWAEEPMVMEDQWLDYCNTTELSCIVRELHTNRLLLFRVRARNEEHGWGPYSEDSERIAEPFVSPEKRGSLVLAIIAPAAIVSSCVLALVLVRKVQKRRLRAKKLLQQSRPSIWSNLSTLQNQQQLLAARNRAFSITLSDADIALLPQISWSQLKLLRFLGSGAFGEVYEGELQLEHEKEPQRVAIKSLRKGDSEFAELLQEAQLMSNFKHENIVCLIGICFDSDSISLIMEHMEAGDLLSYLRAARSNSQQPQPDLILSDLITMCIDVANGCTYLEDMHFVHRDLACRNCLVTETQTDDAGHSRRMVKIGDFGLARDIYKSDYYRKEGEGLLPVRWMSPESLVDGVFTTQSDVWAFGVLCWEILTLGQQPYAARNNFEVLAHVKDGGRLQQPESTPDKLYGLLLQCWRTDPWERPSFKRCFNSLHAISTDLRRSQMPTKSADSTTCISSSSASGQGNGSSIKPETKVHFDKETEQMSLEPISETKLYANEGISRL
ncbi:protein sevenless isoform X2 [Drosophila willistoni]|uniref:protein sevenless isoform X2 n=1 Tax=Drosophila willistoni TaxID=7260 RepID=UPI000C26D91F|nr:protein sevenless isoform X2 [Drosophila willistoni]